ncbi:hypothetical protein GFS31_24190 [Leptolyngbya sp. BL0902]|uniref:hypothetical protein n=1 Tax=Leptolyngbya sp. BL0902 TaxID=1115757 RepID=UPI0018E73F7E|nr:hypothetical protein [Leptolyngbya sp. BL0902]QQE65731.1 hypothetical protein GFS31_24190 [Leptolyngbya sp. BL0902]
MSDQWRFIGSVLYTEKGYRDPRTLPMVLQAEYIRVEVSFLKRPEPDWYRAGWLNQVAQFGTKRLLLPSQVVPLEAPSGLRMDTARPYRIRFAPVPWLPGARVSFWRLL